MVLDINSDKEEGEHMTTAPNTERPTGRRGARLEGIPMGKSAVRFFLAWWGTMVTADGSTVLRQGFTNCSHTLGDVADIGEKGKRGKSSAVQHYNGHAHGRLVAPACIVKVTFPNGAPSAMPYLTTKGCEKVSTKNVGSVESLFLKHGATVEAVEGTGSIPKTLANVLTRAAAKAAEQAEREPAAPVVDRKAAKAAAKAEAKAAGALARQDLSPDAVERQGMELLAAAACKAFRHTARPAADNAEALHHAHVTGAGA